jgi:hypothetical protein
LRNDGRVFVELGLVEAYTDDETFLTVQHEYTNARGLIEIKHVETLEEHAKQANSKLQAALDIILRSVPRVE